MAYFNKLLFVTISIAFGAYAASGEGDEAKVMPPLKVSFIRPAALMMSYIDPDIKQKQSKIYACDDVQVNLLGLLTSRTVPIYSLKETKDPFNLFFGSVLQTPYGEEIREKLLQYRLLIEQEVPRFLESLESEEEGGLVEDSALNRRPEEGQWCPAL